MQAPFHWLRIEVFVYATENEELVTETFSGLACTEEFSTSVSESEHGNTMKVLQSICTHTKEQNAVFRNLGKDIAQHIIDNSDSMIDDDCILYMRLDKQKAVQGELEIAHHGDVFSITGKIASNPAKKKVAVENITKILCSLFPDLRIPALPERSE